MVCHPKMAAKGTLLDEWRKARLAPLASETLGHEVAHRGLELLSGEVRQQGGAGA